MGGHVRRRHASCHQAAALEDLEAAVAELQRSHDSELRAMQSSIDELSTIAGRAVARAKKSQQRANKVRMQGKPVYLENHAEGHAW